MEELNFPSYSCKILSEIGWKVFSSEQIQKFSSKAADCQSRIAELENKNSNYKKQISQYESHLIQERRLKDNAKRNTGYIQDRYNKYLLESGQKFKELEAERGKYREALEEVQSNYRVGHRVITGKISDMV